MSSECAQCHASDKDLRIMLCGDCCSVGYCSKQCQFLHWISHKPICQDAQAISPSTNRDSISKLIERVNAARYQQSRPREFSAFIGPQDVITAAEQSYKDAIRDAETLLRCEPQYTDKVVNDENWIDVRWEWVDICEKILGKGQAALQTLNIFQKKLEAPPILVGANGPFVGQSKKTIQELNGKYDESTNDRESPEGDASASADPSSPCTRCRARGMVCDGRKGRACAPCKKSKLSCNFSSTRAAAAKSKVASKRTTSTNLVAPAIPLLPRTSKRSSTPTQRKLESWAEGVGVTNVVSDQSAAEASKPKAISVPVIRNGVMVQERPSRTLKRKHSFDSSELQSAKSRPSVTTSRDQSNVTSTAKPSSPPNEIPCERCKTSGKSCVGPVGRPCVQCKKVKLGCNFSNPKNAPKASVSTSASTSTSATKLPSAPTPAPAPIIPTFNGHPEPCQRCKEEDIICTGLQGHPCVPCKNLKTECTLASEQQPRPSSTPLIMGPVPAIVPSTPLPPLPSNKMLQTSAPPQVRTSATASGSNANGKPAAFDFQAEFLEPCYYCKETGASCWGLKDFESASGRPKAGSSCWRCLESNRTCSKRTLHPLATPGPSHPISTTSSMALEGFPHGVPITLGPRQHDPTTANPIRDATAPIDRKKPADFALQPHSLMPEIREPSLPEVLGRSIGIKEPKRTLTLLGPKSSQRLEERQGGRKSSNHQPQISRQSCHRCDALGEPCLGPKDLACVACSGLRLKCSLAVDTSKPQEPVVVSSNLKSFGDPMTLKRKTELTNAPDTVDTSRVGGSLAAPIATIDGSVGKLLRSEQSTKKLRIDETKIDSAEPNETKQSN